MSHLLSDHPDWPNAMTTPTPRSNREWRELAEQAQRDLAAAQEARQRAEEHCSVWIDAAMEARERARRAEALAESYKALLIEAQRECHEDNGLIARIEAAIAGEPK